MKFNNWRYFSSLLIFAGIPTAYFSYFLSTKQILLIVILIVYTTIWLTPWDMVSALGSKAVKRWLWDFNPKEILGFKILGLPFEEFVYFVFFVSFPISAWEFFKSLNINGNVGAGLVVIAGLAAVILFPLLSKPNK